MIERDYDAAADSWECWRLAVMALREIAVRDGVVEPINDDERRQAAEGPVRTLDCVSGVVHAR